MGNAAEKAKQDMIDAEASILKAQEDAKKAGEEVDKHIQATKDRAELEKLTKETKMKSVEYETARNRLIPTAEKYADETVGNAYIGREDRDSWADAWNNCFHKEMNRLWCEKVRKDAEYDFGS